MSIDSTCRRAAAAAVVLAAWLALPVADAAAETKPLWELGVGASGLAFPDYRGSDQTRLHALPVPYVIYRGDLFRADRDGIRGILFDRDNVEFNLSVGASFPVDSGDNDARRGMDDLRPTVEVGPALDLTVWRSADRRLTLTVRVPVRAGFTVERSPRAIGWLATPRLNLDVQDVGGIDDLQFGMFASPTWADRRFHQYFYSVPQASATPDRPAYEARAGYGGVEFLASLTRRYGAWWVGAFVRCDVLDGAVFVDSPLVKSRRYVAGGLAFAWVFAESPTRVDAPY